MRLDVMEQIVSCTACELHAKSSGPVSFTGPTPTTIAIQGEAPGQREDAEGRPFIGPAGDLLRKELEASGIAADDCFIFNTVSCFPNSAPTSPQIAACRPNRVAQLALADPTWVLLLGKYALSSTRSNLRISAARGRPFRLNNTGPVFFATFHPAAALRNSEYAKTMAADLRAFAELVSGGVDNWLERVVWSCWECASEDWVHLGPDHTVWCKKHAPPEYTARQALLQKEYEEAKARLEAKESAPLELPLSDPGANEVQLQANPQDTAAAAALTAWPTSGTQRMRVLEYIAIHHPAGVIDEEIAAAVSAESPTAAHAHRTRRNELVKGGWVRDSGKRRKTAAGVDSIIWILTGAGENQWRKQDPFP